MGIFDFFKKTDKVGKDSAIDSKELVQGSKKDASAGKEVVTKLSFHPEWNVPQEQQYVFRFLANELEPLKPNQLSLAAISIEEDARNGAWHVKAFFRSSLPQPIELGDIELILLDKDEKRLASKAFNFKELGQIPAESARPWVFTFDKNSIDAEEVPEEGWKIAFNLISLRGHQLDLDDTWKKQLPQEQQDALEKIVKDLPKLGKKEVNFTGLQAKLQDDKSLHASVFIRNGNDKAINLEQLPLEIIDANGKMIAKGSFKLDPVLTVQPNSTKPWTFIFPAELVNAEDADFSRWTARVVQ
ncbi:MULTISPECIES: accessory Sec system S-layer assembly protein [Lysinibacillus]|uniref:Accessory Sec system S-layer assembly protein n=1 Tax=Lysinibacillus antri TaxID=2498145 RepID=A0A432LD55_9BACI|nr:MULTISPECIES: accessory Sec system S-layer assembly protein [Lysinibacillus]RUL54166.1 accessory Sec system S-layer assembly protein [Lysinibacillus antri]TSI07346.1 accessory Sec system S-layer assembly protein [Lysinibacillus sp. BW-2-10]